MLHFGDVHKRYGGGEVTALRGLSLDMEGAGFFAWMGPSGSGKSTALHLAAALDRPDAGTVHASGEAISTLSERRLAPWRRRRVGLVFQRYNLLPTLTARQNIAMPGWLDRRPRRWLRPRVEELLQQLALGERADHRPDQLSGGEQQRVAIARALLLQPPLLLADEPTGNLDAGSSDNLLALLRGLARQQELTVVMVTHEPAAAAWCDHVMVLRDGSRADDFNVADMSAETIAARVQRVQRTQETPAAP